MILIPIVLTIFSKFKTGTLKNPIFLVSLWWGIWAFLSSFGLLGLYVPRTRTYGLIITFIIFFSLGALFLVKKFEVTKSIEEIYLSTTTKKKLKVLFYLQFIVLIILIPYLIKSIPNILSMDSSKYRLAVFNGNILYQSSNIRILFDLLVEPIINIGLLLGIVGLFLGYKTKKLLILSILNAIVFSVMTLGRWYFLRIFFFLVLGYFFISKHKKIIPKNILKKNKKILAIVIPISIFAMIIMSFIRSEQDKPIFFIAYEYVIRYFTAPFIALDQFIKNFSYEPNYYFGRVTFTPLDTILVYIIRIFDESVVNVTERISVYTQDFIHIGNGYMHNGFYTVIYNFYLDGGLIAVIIFSFLLGVIVGIAFNKFSRNPNLFTSSLLILLIYISMIASLRWEFIKMWPFTTILLLFTLITNFKLKA